jgi:hypothetical protein
MRQARVEIALGAVENVRTDLGREIEVIRCSVSIQVKLGQCAKEGPHNGPKCLTVVAEH